MSKLALQADWGLLSSGMLDYASVTFQEEEDTWYYTVGCILGELSGQLFPATSEEYARWETDRLFWKAEAGRTLRREADTEALPITVQEPARVL